MKIKRNIFHKAFFYLFPQKCIYCGQILSEEKYLCAECQGKITHGNFCFCTDCERFYPLQTELFPANRCACGGWLSIIPFRYLGKEREALLRYKFGGKMSYASYYASNIISLLEQYGILEQLDEVTFVPTTFGSIYNRSYDCAKRLAKETARRIKLPFCSLLRPTHKNFSQKQLSLSLRKKSMDGVFSVKKNKRLAGKTILLCDDIMTSGATLKRCAFLLEEQGATVYCCAIANGSSIKK